MNSMPNRSPGNPDDVLVARADERLAHAYAKITDADEQLARVTAQLSRMERDSTVRPSAARLRRPAPRGRPVLRGLVGLVLAAGIFAAAFAVQSPGGDAARMKIAQWLPPLAQASSQTNPVDSTSPGPSTVQLAAAGATPTLLAASSQTPAQDAVPIPAPAPAPMPPELTQMLQGMAHDIATLEQGIEQLKASQEKMAADNAQALEQLKASQEQLAHLVAKPPAPEPRAKKPAAPARPLASNAAVRPLPIQPAAQARPRPPAQ
jgi:predicted FMN-binding regulatory protein PaiB